MKKEITNWLNAKNKFVSALGDGDEYTNLEVALTHIVTAAMLGTVIIAGSLLS